jgi:hypothetical protein
LGIILTAVNKIWSISKKRTDEDTKAKEDNEKQTTKLGKTAKKVGQILKTSIIGLLASAGASFVAFFKGSQEGAVEYEKITARISAGLEVLFGRIANLGKGLFLFIRNAKDEFALFRKEIQLSSTFFDDDAKAKLQTEIDEIKDRLEKGGKEQGEAFGKAFAGGFFDQIEGAGDRASELVIKQFEIANLQREQSSEIEKQKIAEEELIALYDDDTRGFIERQEASRKLTGFIESQTTALDKQLSLNKNVLELSQEQALLSLQTKGFDDATLKNLREQVKAGEDLSTVILNAQNLRGANGLLEIDTTALDNLIQAEKDAFQTEAELQAFRLDNRAKQRKLLFDEVEQELDFLIDGTDQIIQNNQKIIDSERSTFDARQKALESTVELIEDSRQRIFEEIAKTVDGVSEEDIAGAFADVQSEEDLRNVVSNLNKNFKELGLAEIPINRLLEVYREGETQKRDIKEVQELLFFANIDAEEARERIKVLNEFNEAVVRQKNELLELSKVDVSQLSAEELEEFQKKLDDFNKRREENQEDLQKTELENEIANLEERLRIEQEFIGTKEEDSQKILEIEEELARKRTELNEITIEDINKQNEEAVEKRKQELQDIADAEAKAAEERKKAYASLIGALENISDEYFEGEQEKLQNQIDASKDAEEQLIEQANTGVALAEESIAFERKKQAELARDQQKLAEKQARTELLLASLSSLNANDGDLGKTITDIVALREFANSFPLFFDGTEDTGAGGNVDEKGGFHAILHPHERVIDARKNSRIGAMSNEELTSLAEMYQSGHMNGGVTIEANKNSEVEMLRREIRDLPARMPQNKLNYDPLRKALVEEVSVKGRKTRYIHKGNKLF